MPINLVRPGGVQPSIDRTAQLRRSQSSSTRVSRHPPHSQALRGWTSTKRAPSADSSSQGTHHPWLPQQARLRLCFRLHFFDQRELRLHASDPPPGGRL
ncbi:hypothetical protein PGTUg99_031820 [Puccinia graminis f. sp. tritici]|uniref:Uncharacterized protein n=1 Tax=Puccinia graminis f. sp. tritici TaxID=56615 RepID=A0A5B0RVZ9_PUCGR|nr:hypothetical protein PGTUg99_031820 [Puccinia graminis f. sp. tritici]